MFAAFFCKEETISPSQTKNAESDEEIINYNAVQDLNIESSFLDNYSTQKVILNNTILSINQILFRFFIERKGQFLDCSVF